MARPQPVKNRVLVIGLDGATFRVLDPLMKKGLMPNLAKLAEGGVVGELQSVLPTNSAAAWASFMTGNTPGKHGVFDFRLRSTDDFYRIVFANSRTVRGQSLWRRLSNAGKRVGVINVPLAYPPEQVSGFIVSGMLTPSLNHPFTYPPSLRDELLSKVDDYIIDTNWIYYANKVEELLRDLTRMTVARTEATLYLMDRYPDLDFLIVVFMGTDRLQHCLWRFLDRGHPRHDVEEASSYAEDIEKYFAVLDTSIGQILDKAGHETTVFVISDHGFHAADKKLVINDLLAEMGLLVRREGHSRVVNLLSRLDVPLVQKFRAEYLNLKNIPGRVRALSVDNTIDWTRTKAYCNWDYQQSICINLAGREPDGIVQPGREYEELRALLKVQLAELQDPSTGEEVIEQVLYREECYGSKFLESAPDLLIIPCDNYSVSSTKHRLFDPTGWESGDHSPYGIFIACGCGIREGEKIYNLRLVDLAPTIHYALGVDPPRNLDGRLLLDIFQPTFLRQHPSEFQGEVEDSLADKTGFALTEDEEQQLERRLRGLGYLA